MATRFGRAGFQARLTLVAAAAVAVAVAMAAAVMYFVVRGIVLGQVDSSLVQRAEGTHLGSGATVSPGEIVLQPLVLAPSDPGGAGGIVQLVGADGSVGVVNPDGTVTIAREGSVRLRVSAQDLSIANGCNCPTFRDDRLKGKPYRIYTQPFLPRVALEVGRPLGETYAILAEIQAVLGIIAAGGVVLAAILGWFIAKAGLRPIYRLRAAVDHVTDTGDMSQRVREGEDELGRLGAHFNRMLGGLDQSLRTQRQLVADASHELRTPLASLRTNIEVLQRSPDLPLGERNKLLRDVIAQVEQLTRLIGDLIDLARGDQTPEEREQVRLDYIVASAVERAAINWPTVRFTADLRESTVVAQASRVERAVSNLLDNAGKWSSSGQVVEVRVTDHEVTVRDHGPGIDAADLPFVFDRFWRAPAARAMPGSGLGLSIVRQVADTHHATVTAELPDGGGTLMRFKFADS